MRKSASILISGLVLFTLSSVFAIEIVDFSIGVDDELYDHLISLTFSNNDTNQIYYVEVKDCLKSPPAQWHSLKGHIQSSEPEVTVSIGYPRHRQGFFRVQRFIPVTLDIIWDGAEPDRSVHLGYPGSLLYGSGAPHVLLLADSPFSLPDGASAEGMSWFMILEGPNWDDDPWWFMDYTLHNVTLWEDTWTVIEVDFSAHPNLEEILIIIDVDNQTVSAYGLPPDAE